MSYCHVIDIRAYGSVGSNIYGYADFEVVSKLLSWVTQLLEVQQKTAITKPSNYFILKNFKCFLKQAKPALS